jgi:HSP20 family protein
MSQDWWGDLDQMQRQMEQFLEHVTSFKRNPVMFSTGVWQPLVDVYETADAVLVVAELAGVVRDDIRIVLDNNVLHLAGERRDRRPHTPRQYSVMELSYGRFEREIELPAAVVPESTRANLESGLLVIVMAKAPEPAARQVRVTTESGTEE